MDKSEGCEVMSCEHECVCGHKKLIDCYGCASKITSHHDTNGVCK